MNEFVLVEFIAIYPFESDLLLSRLRNLRYEDFIIIKEDDESEGERKEWLRVTAKINSTYATMIKLQDPFLAERMRISYIPTELKNKYRE